MAEELIVTKIAERGHKYDETGQCITSHERSIVFLPINVKPGELVRVRLIPITDENGNKKTDVRGQVMYRAEYAWPKIAKQFKERISQEARMLRACRALPREEGQAVLKALYQSLPSQWADFDWYYFREKRCIMYGCHFSPAALLLLENFEKVEGSGSLELLAWLLDTSYYKKRKEGKIPHPPNIPNIPSDNKTIIKLASHISHLPRRVI